MNKHYNIVGYCYIVSGIDVFVANGFIHSIEAKLGMEAIEKINQRIHEKYGTTLLESLVSHFDWFDLVFREFYGKAADMLEKKFLDDFCSIQYSKTQETEICTSDQNIIKKFSEVLQDSALQSIIQILRNQPMTSLELCKNIPVQQASTYRKLNMLLKLGMIQIDSFGKTSDAKKVPKYGVAFKSIHLNLSGHSSATIVIDKNKIYENDLVSCVQKITA